MVYETLFLIGLVGLAAQALLGTAGHGHAHVGHAGHSGAAHGGHAGHSGAGHEGHHASPSHPTGGTSNHAPGWLLDMLSPLTAFSLCLGVGAVGLILRRLPHTEQMALALLGGLLFYALLVKPIWNLIFRFASEPAKALDGAVAGTAEALSHFDTSGKGLVRVTVDGQLVRVLAFLEPDERAEAVSVQPGDQLVIVSVDGRANTCRVARL